MSKLPITTFDLPDVAKPPSNVNPISRWDTFLGDLAAGAPLPEAMERNYVCRADIETMCRLNDGGMQRQRWDDAVLAGRKRKWTVFEFEDIFERIAAGALVADAVTAVKGLKTVGAFYDLIARDPDLRARYQAAKEAHALGIGEELFVIADNKTGDTLPGPKGGEIPNMANVTRDKLRVETRWRYMGAYHSRLFGERKEAVNVQVNVNPVERLEEARERARLQDKRVTPKQQVKAIDAVFSEKTAEAADDDTKWMDDKPSETIWREDG
jgi:hypothetical protein